MSKEFAREFYNSTAWKNCRDSYKSSVHGLCEKCLANGRITAAEIVHHKVHITEQNINDPNVTLNWDNLEALCRECHAAEHGARQRRYKVDDMGRVIFL